MYNDGNKVTMSKFKNLKKSGLYTHPKIDDKEFFDDVTSAFKKLDFSADEVDAIFRILVAILYMGNLEIDESTYEDQKTPAEIKKDDAFEKIVQLLDCDPKLLEASLTAKIKYIPG